MNAEMIDLYRKVQGQKGPWRPFDRCHYKEYGCGTVAEIYENYMVGVIFDREPRTMHYYLCDDPDLLWLPPVYSDDDRCLWAMVDWERLDIGILESPQISIFKRGKLNPVHTCNALPEALLRAIASHE